MQSVSSLRRSFLRGCCQQQTCLVAALRYAVAANVQIREQQHGIDIFPGYCLPKPDRCHGAILGDSASYEIAAALQEFRCTVFQGPPGARCRR